MLFNRGLSLIYLGRVEEGLQLMEEGRKHKETEEHNVIDDAIRDRGEGYTVFSIVSLLLSLIGSDRLRPMYLHLACWCFIPTL